MKRRKIILTADCESACSAVELRRADQIELYHRNMLIERIDLDEQIAVEVPGNKNKPKRQRAKARRC